MAKKPAVTTISAGYASTTTLNDNFDSLREGFDNTLSLDGSGPNSMQADLDMDGNDILNAGSIKVGGQDLLALTQASLAAAQTAQTAAEAAEVAAETSETNAAASASSASTSASNASTSASQAASSAVAASGSATAAAASVVVAESAEAGAETAETNAAASAVAASTSATNAATSETNAASSATAAATSETNAASSASSASIDADYATGAASTIVALAPQISAAATLAADSAEDAEDFATAASSSASTATTQASNAATSASNAATSASNASTSETNAATSATSASNSATAATAAKDAALEALDSFDDRYLGQKASDPTLDNDGDALVAGALYFNTTDDIMKVYEGSVWVAAYASLSGALLTNNNLSDLANVSAARTNLGLGTAATTASTDYATAAQGVLADSAVQPNTAPTFTDLTLSDGTPVLTLSDSDGSGLTGKILQSGGATYFQSRNDGSNGQFIFRGESTSGTQEYARFNSVGNLGIGTSSPTYPLDVVGSIRAQGASPALYITESDVGNTHRIVSAGGDLYIQASDTDSTNDGRLYLTGWGGSEAEIIEHRSGTHIFESNGSERLRITSLGRVGIGTSSPATELDVAGTVTADDLIVDGSTGNIQLRGNTYTDFSDYWGTTNNAAMFLPYGYLGSNGGFATSLFSNGYRNNSGGFTSMGINGNSAASGVELLPTGDILFRTGNPSGTSIPERVRIDDTGNVGIGTSSPQEKLDVNGTVQATAFVGDGSALTGISTAPTTTQVLSATAGASAGGVGTYAFLGIGSSNQTITAGSTYAGSILKYAGIVRLNFDWGAGEGEGVRAFQGTGTLLGTWMCMGHSISVDTTRYPATLFLRIA